MVSNGVLIVAIIISLMLGCGIGLFISALMSMTKEEKHGKIIVKDHDEWWGKVYECSICGGEWQLGNHEKAMYCPLCGARLESEVTK